MGYIFVDRDDSIRSLENDYADRVRALRKAKRPGSVTSPAAVNLC